MRVGIIGAGIAGLSAGYRLAGHGVHPVIFEKGACAGGRMGSDHVDGFTIDRGAYTIPETHHRFLGLIDELGLSGSLVETPGTSSIFTGGGEHKMKVGSPGDFLKYRLLTPKDKKDLLTLFLYAKSLGKRLDLIDPTPKTLELETETAADYLTREYGREMLEKIAAPIFADLFLGVPEDNSRAAFLASFRGLIRSGIYTLNTGMGAVAQKLQERLDVRTNTTVLRVDKNRETGTWSVKLKDAPDVHEFDRIISAVPLPMAAELFRDLPEPLKHRLKDTRYTPSVVVAMGLKKPFHSQAFMVNFLRQEIDTLATVVPDHFKGTARIPAGQGLVTAILTKNAGETLYDATDDEVAGTVLSRMDSLWPGFPANVLFTRVIRWPMGAVQLPPGALGKQVRMRKELAGLDRSIAFAGDGLYRASLEISLRTGFKAADRVMGRN